MKKSASVALLSTCLLIFSCFFACQLQASEDSSKARGEARGISTINAKVKFSFGYDDNVSERREDKVESRFYQIYMSSGMCMVPSERTLLSLRLQDGLKYLDAPSLSGESVLINSLNISLSHKISERLMPELQSEIRSRTSIHSKSDISPSEEAYLRGSAGLGLKALIYNDITGRAFYRYRFTNFEDFDPFDRRGALMGVRADVKLLPELTVGVQYSRDDAYYSKWVLVFSEEEEGTSRRDKLDDVSVYVQIYKYFLFDVTYSHQQNNSDISGYSYRSNKFALLMARSLPKDIMFQLHALIRSKKYSSGPNDLRGSQIDLEDDERGMLTLKLSKDIGRGCALEGQYDLRRASSQEKDAIYTKGVFTLSLSLQF